MSGGLAGVAALALGPLGWTPATFWSACPPDLAFAVVKKAQPRTLPPLGRRDYLALKDALEPAHG